MKHIKLLLIISNILIINSCKNDNSKIINENKFPLKQDTLIKEEKIAKEFFKDSLHIIKEDSLIKINNISDSLSLITKQKADNLKVIINGKIYYKRNEGDFRIGKTFVFRTKNEMTDYDIRKDGTLPSGYNTGEEN